MSISVRLACCLLCGLLLAGPACAQEDRSPAISDDQFVRVLVALRRAADEHHADAAAFDAARRQILENAGVTDSLLYRYVNVRARDLERLSRVFDEIRDSLRVMPDSLPR